MARLAKSLETLRNQINAASPSRSKASDGWIGDAAHKSRASDHNPWVDDGVVTAIDITHDPARGVDTWKLADHLRERRDPRVKYIISNGRIASAEKGWTWRKYTGKNPHSHHVHISVHPDHARYDDTKPWDIDFDKTPHGEVEPDMLVVRVGMKGAIVRKVQELVGGVAVDGDFGPKTEKAIKAFQRERRLVADGIVGAYTWRALMERNK